MSGKGVSKREKNVEGRLWDDLVYSSSIFGVAESSVGRACSARFSGNGDGRATAESCGSAPDAAVVLVLSDVEGKSTALLIGLGRGQATQSRPSDKKALTWVGCERRKGRQGLLIRKKAVFSPANPTAMGCPCEICHTLSPSEVCSYSCRSPGRIRWAPRLEEHPPDAVGGEPSVHRVR
jgi:hypothetical protein